MEIIVNKERVQITSEKTDLKDLEIKLYKALAAQTIVIIGAVAGLLQIL